MGGEGGGEKAGVGSPNPSALFDACHHPSSACHTSVTPPAFLPGYFTAFGSISACAQISSSEPTANIWHRPTPYPV